MQETFRRVGVTVEALLGVYNNLVQANVSHRCQQGYVSVTCTTLLCQLVLCVCVRAWCVCVCVRARVCVGNICKGSCVVGRMSRRNGPKLCMDSQHES